MGDPGDLQKAVQKSCDQIDDQVASVVIAQLLYLEGQDPEKDIDLYINSPGGVITAGMAIYDTMNYIKSDVSTICIGMAASMAAFLLSSGAQGKRYSLKNSEVMIHQPLGGAEGQATEIKIAAERILRIRKKMNKILSENTGKSYKKIEKTGNDIKTIEKDTERDYFMTSDEALSYGIIDKIL